MVMRKFNIDNSIQYIPQSEQQEKPITIKNRKQNKK